MYYIFNQDGKNIGQCDFEPDADDLASRGESAYHSDTKLSNPTLSNGRLHDIATQPSKYHTLKDGQWVITQANQARLDGETLAAAKTQKIQQINITAQNHIDTVAKLEQVPSFEVQTWTIQAIEAKEWYADHTKPTPTLDTIAAARGIPPEILRQKALEKALAFERLSAYVAGVRQRLTDLAQNAVSIDELDKIVITFDLPNSVQGGV